MIFVVFAEGQQQEAVVVAVVGAVVGGEAEKQLVRDDEVEKEKMVAVAVAETRVAVARVLRVSREPSKCIRETVGVWVGHSRRVEVGGWVFLSWKVWIRRGRWSMGLTTRRKWRHL